MEEMELTAAGLEMVKSWMFDLKWHDNKDDEEDFGTGQFAIYQKSLWDLIEHSESSLAAQVL